MTQFCSTLYHVSITFVEWEWEWECTCILRVRTKQNENREWEIFLQYINKGVVYAWRRKTKTKRTKKAARGDKNRNGRESLLLWAMCQPHTQTEKRIWAMGPNWFSVMHLNYIHVWLTRWSSHDFQCGGCVCVCLCAMHCAHCAYVCFCIYTTYDIHMQSSKSSSQCSTVNVFTPVCLHGRRTQTYTDSHKWWWYTDAQYNKAKLCGISLFMVQHVLFAHWKWRRKLYCMAANALVPVLTLFLTCSVSHFASFYRYSFHFRLDLMLTLRLSLCYCCYCCCCLCRGGGALLPFPPFHFISVHSFIHSLVRSYTHPFFLCSTCFFPFYFHLSPRHILKRKCIGHSFHETTFHRCSI